MIMQLENKALTKNEAVAAGSEERRPKLRLRKQVLKVLSVRTGVVAGVVPDITGGNCGTGPTF